MKKVYPGNKVFREAFAFCLLLFCLLQQGLAQYTKSGTVYEDYNANRSINTGEPGTNAGGNLCAYLVHSNSHTVLYSQPVAAAGSFSFSVPSLSGANYNLAIGKCGIAIGTVFTGGTANYNSYLSIPSGWSIVDPGDAQWRSVGNASNSNNNIFYIRKTPTVANVQSQQFPCPSSGCVSIPGLSGTAASGSASYTLNYYKIVTIPEGGTLKSGSNTLTAGEFITAAEAANLCFSKSSNAVGNVTFKYLASNYVNSIDYFSTDTAIYTIRLGGAGFRRDAPSSVLLAINNQPVTLYAPFTSDTTGQTFSYNWTGPGGFSSTVKTPVLPANTAVEDGLYIVTATDQSGCQSKDTLKAKRMTSFATCDGANAYMVKGSGSTGSERLYRYNMQTGVTTTVVSNLTSVDAICYNIHNNLIYGWAEGNSPIKHIYAIDAAGKYVDLGLSGDESLYEDVYFAGTASADGKWYMARGLGDADMMVTDIDPKSPTYLRLLQKIQADGGTFDPWDLTWSSCDSMIYGVSGDELYKIHPQTGVITKFDATVTNGDGSYGAQFIDHNCYHYISESSSGNIYRTSLATTPTGPVTFTLMSGGPTGSYNDATVNPTQPTDFGDAPASYGQAYHKFNCAAGPGTENLFLGATVDYEASSWYSSDSKGDDMNNTGASDDEDGVAALPQFSACNDITTFSITVSTINTTGGAATLSGWIDLNSNGIFDAGERRQATVANGQTSAVLTWTGVTTSFIPNSYTYARFRIGSSVASPSGSSASGEVEDYSIPVLGRDDGDAPVATYGTPVSKVFPDADSDNVPDDAAALWLGTYCRPYDGATPCAAISNTAASGDDNDGLDDEDSYTPIGYFFPGIAKTVNFIANGNTHNQQGYYGLWIDWNNNGFQDNANEFYTGTFTVGSPVSVDVSVTAPAGPPPSTIYFRFRVAAAPLTYSNYNSTLLNGETEDYFYINGSQIPLPVTFMNFTATKTGDNVLLQWQTGTEVDNDGFEIQHSLNGTSWSALGFVNGAGNSSSVQNYSYVHLNPGKSTHYYRIRQVDRNGQSTLSAIRKINFKGEHIIQVYPNPAKDQLFVASTLGKNIKELNLYNTSKQQVLQMYNVSNGGSINVSKLAPGIYFLRLIYENEEPEYRKVVIY